MFKAVALVGAFVIILAAWYWDASLLTTLADQNLHLLKIASGLLPAGLAAKVESAMRILGADRALLLVEGIATAKMAMLALALPFRRSRP